MQKNINDIMNRLKEAIVNSGYSYARLEELTGHSRSSIQRYTSGTTSKIPIDFVIAVAPILGVTAEYLMGWEAEASSTTATDEITDDENKLLKHYRALNKSGKAEAIKRVSELSEIRKYTEIKKEEAI